MAHHLDFDNVDRSLCGHVFVTVMSEGPHRPALHCAECRALHTERKRTTAEASASRKSEGAKRRARAAARERKEQAMGGSAERQKVAKPRKKKKPAVKRAVGYLEGYRMPPPITVVHGGLPSLGKRG